MVVIKRALISVYDKEGVVELARFLSSKGIELISSGGTAKLLTDSGLEVIEVSDYTGSPEMMDGRVKTLHPKIHGGILADRSKKAQMEEAARHGIGQIDLVVLNLYPFERTVLSGAGLEEAVEKIDVGGPAMLRSAAKNYRSVAVVVSPAFYPRLMEEIEKHGRAGPAFRSELALAAWEHVSHYDVIIERYFRKVFKKRDEYPEFLNLTFRKKQDLRYGENPHQSAAFYVDDHYLEPSISTARQLQGKTLSYNNILDGNAALELLKEFEGPTAVVVKHNNPSGVASHADIHEAFVRARGVDPEAAFGGVAAINREVDGALAKEISSNFMEIVIAPSFTQDALALFSKKKNLRLLTVDDIDKKRKLYRKFRSVVGGLLVQDANVILHDGQFRVVTKRKPTEEEIASMKYAWKVCKYVKSNSIVYARSDRVVGIGAGQMKRVDAAKVAAMIAEGFGSDIRGCAMASDAFFPFRDGIDAAAERGISAVIQPGGSIRDQEVIKAADEHGIAMVFTGVRHFRH